MKLRAEAFQPAQLRQLNAALSPELVAWAAGSQLVDTDGEYQPVRSLAALCAFDRAQLARVRLKDFRRTVLRHGTLGGPRPELDGLTPREVGGRAAGHLALARTIATWYGLEGADFSRLAEVEEAVMGSMLVAGLAAAVWDAPQQLDIAGFTPRDVYHATVPEAAMAVSVHGSGALGPYVDFSAYPEIMDPAA